MEDNKTSDGISISEKLAQIECESGLTQEKLAKANLDDKLHSLSLQIQTELGKTEAELTQELKCPLKQFIMQHQPGRALEAVKQELKRVEMSRTVRIVPDLERPYRDANGNPLIGTEAAGFYKTELTSSGYPKRTPCYEDLWSAFNRDTPYKYIREMRVIYAFNGTHYVELIENEIKNYAEKKMVPKPDSKIRGEFYNKVIVNNIESRSFFTDTIEGKINCRNGVLDIKTRTLSPHSPKYGFRYVLPYDYDPAAVCTAFDFFINDVMMGDQDQIKILQEYMGYIMSGSDYIYNKALWLAGSGRNGKSTFIDVLKALIGKGNYSILSIKEISEEKFSRDCLDGKLANFSEETTPEELHDSGPFKNLTGDGEVSAEKKFGGRHEFKNRAKLVMSYNDVPLLKDLTVGMLSRPLITSWLLDLTDDAKQDKTLKPMMLCELPGILNFALIGWDRLQANGHFTYSEKSLLALEEVREASCTVAQWVKEKLDFVDFETTPVKPKTFYEAYKQSTAYPYSEQKFYKRFNAILFVKKRRERTREGSEYFGIVFKQNLM